MNFILFTHYNLGFNDLIINVQLYFPVRNNVGCEIMTVNEFILTSFHKVPMFVDLKFPS